MQTWIPTATGGRVWFEPIDVSQVKLRDVAVGLSRVCRFAGQMSQLVPFYSVAEHSVWASYIAPPGQRIAALVHDAAEAFIGDVTSPLKHMLPDYKELEARFEAALWKHFDWPDSKTAAVKSADRRMLARERLDLVQDQRTLWTDCEGIIPADVKLEKWLPTMAAVVWEDRYKQLQERGDY